MKAIFCIGLILIVLFVAGCETNTSVSFNTNFTHIKYDWGYDTGNQVHINDYGSYATIYLNYGKDDSDARVRTYCDDGVICYDYRSQGESCFRTKDLVDKYCGWIAEGKRAKYKLLSNVSITN